MSSGDSSRPACSKALLIGALGVVFGDIGTSPLYAFRESLVALGGQTVDARSVTGILSLTLWALILIVCIKYLALVLRADNRGEGGILALLALVAGENAARGRKLLVACGILGATLLYGDGVITPCITVLGAVEGLKVATDFFDPYVVPLSLAILFVLFIFQRAGTARVGRVFGPVMLLWFLILALLGIRGILLEPAVLASFNPLLALSFLTHHPQTGFVVVGAVFLAVTGSEALYADLGHFGVVPIRRGWFAIVFPSLALNYLGQGGLVLARPEAVANPFFMLGPGWAIYPLVILSTAASVIASQALITGAYSITMQAIQLGFLPRMEIRHTSATERGQIYMPLVNSLLLVGCLVTVVGFGSSGRLASAYGIAVTLTMIVTTILFGVVARRNWKWSLPATLSVCAGFLAIELLFFAANALKIAHGGWFPLLIAVAMYAVMSTWKTGRQLLYNELAPKMLPVEHVLDEAGRGRIARVRGTAVYLAGKSSGTPVALLHNLKLNQSLHERLILLTMVTTEDPRVDAARRVKIEDLTGGFYRVIASYGFMETPDVPEVLKACAEQGLDVRTDNSTFILSRESIVMTGRLRWPRWRSRLFAYMARNAQPATAFFGLPPNRVVELGVQIGI